MCQLKDVSNAAVSTTGTLNASVKRLVLCALKNKLKECTTSRPEYKCINCATYNTYNKDRKTNENHSSIDRNCPSLQAMIVKYRQNTNY